MTGAVNVQSMVFGNMGNTSATGVAFSRNPANGDNKFYGEWLINAQGEDVVAGIRTPNPLNEATKTPHNADLASLETAMPEVYKELDDTLRNTSTICRTSSSPFRTANSGCSSAVSEREQVSLL